MPKESQVQAWTEQSRVPKADPASKSFQIAGADASTGRHCLLKNRSGTCAWWHVPTPAGCLACGALDLEPPRHSARVAGRALVRCKSKGHVTKSPAPPGFGRPSR